MARGCEAAQRGGSAHGGGRGGAREQWHERGRALRLQQRLVAGGTQEVGWVLRTSAYQCVCVYARLPTCLPAYLSTHLSVCLPGSLSTHLSVCLPIYLHICLSVCLAAVVVVDDQSGDGGGGRLGQPRRRGRHQQPQQPGHDAWSTRAWGM